MYRVVGGKVGAARAPNLSLPGTVCPFTGRSRDLHRQADRRKLRLSDLGRLSAVGLRTRKLRAGLSALGIAIGVAAIVAVLGLSQSSSAGLRAQIAKLGTNLLTVTNGQSLTGSTAELPITAPGMIARIGPVTQVQYIGSVTANVCPALSSPPSTPTP